VSIKLILKRNDIAANLQAYGEIEVASHIADLSDGQYESICEIGGKLSLEGKKFAEAACLAAIEVVEGQTRGLRNKKRNWSLVEPILLEPDPVVVEIDQWFARYAGGDAISTVQLVERVRTIFLPYLPDFKYLKSKRCFRRKTAYGFQHITIEASQRHGLSFRFGLRHEMIELLLDKIRDQTPNKYSREFSTISKWSYNMGPNHRHWKHHIYPIWPISGEDGLAVALPEIERFLEEIMLPFLEEHVQVEGLRDTFLNHPFRVDQMSFAATVFAVDVLTGRGDRIDDDFLRMKPVFHNWGESSQREIAAHLERAKQLSIDT
jgi:hypothetical protein